MFLAVWRMDSEQDQIRVPVKAHNASIIYGLDDIGVCTVCDNDILVKINEKNNAVLIEIN